MDKRECPVQDRGFRTSIVSRVIMRRPLIIAGVLLIVVAVGSLWVWFSPVPTPPEPTARPEMQARETEAEPAERELQLPAGPATQPSPSPIRPSPEAQPSEPASPSESELASKLEDVADRSAPPKMPQAPVRKPSRPEGKESSAVLEETRESLPPLRSPAAGRPAPTPSKKPTAPSKPKKPQLAAKAPSREAKKEIKPSAKLEAKIRETRIPLRPTKPGFYETITVATARSAPSDSAAVVDRIRGGKILNVTGSEGDWLVVHSQRRNITVYVKRKEAMYSANQNPWGASSKVPESRWKDIEREIQRSIIERGVTGVTVSFIGDTAYLKGTVKTEMERHRAELAAHSLPEVKHIFTVIRVDRTWYFELSEGEIDQPEEYAEE